MSLFNKNKRNCDLWKSKNNRQTHFSKTKKRKQQFHFFKL